MMKLLSIKKLTISFISVVLLIFCVETSIADIDLFVDPGHGGVVGPDADPQGRQHPFQTSMRRT